MNAILELNGIQSVVSLSPGAQPPLAPRYQVIWNERDDGPLPLPISELGGFVRNGTTLSVDPVKKAAQEAKQAAKVARMAIVRAAKSANSIAALRALVIAMAEELGHEIDP